MNDTIKIWENSEFGTVRTVEIDGEPWLVGKDVAEVLGYSNTRDALIRHVDEEDKNTVVNPDGNKGNPNMVVINESGLYALVFRSKLLINNPELGVRAFTALMEERQKTKALEAKVAEKQEQITELTPKATYCDVVLMSDDLVSVTEIAKDYGKSAQWLNKLLHEYGIQFNQRGVWHLYQPYAEGGYAVTRKQILPGRDGETHVREHTYWTQDGRKFLYEFLKRKGILPITERVT